MDVGVGEGGDGDDGNVIVGLSLDPANRCSNAAFNEVREKILILGRFTKLIYKLLKLSEQPESFLFHPVHLLKLVSPQAAQLEIQFFAKN